MYEDDDSKAEIEVDWTAMEERLMSEVFQAALEEDYRNGYRDEIEEGGHKMKSIVTVAIYDPDDGNNIEKIDEIRKFCRRNAFRIVETFTTIDQILMFDNENAALGYDAIIINGSSEDFHGKDIEFIDLSPDFDYADNDDADDYDEDDFYVPADDEDLPF